MQIIWNKNNGNKELDEKILNTYDQYLFNVLQKIYR